MVASQRTLLFYEGQGRQSLSQHLDHRQLNCLALTIGTEGGFCEEEFAVREWALKLCLLVCVYCGPKQLALLRTPLVRRFVKIFI